MYKIASQKYHFNREEILHATIIKFITSLDLCAHLRPTVWCELDQSVVNHAIDEWRRRLSVCVDAEGGHFEQNVTFLWFTVYITAIAILRMLSSLYMLSYYSYRNQQ